MDGTALLVSLGFARPSASEAMESFRKVFPGVRVREGGRVRAFDERTTVGLMLGQALGRNAPCKDAARRAQLEPGMDVSASTAAFCKARGRVAASTLEGMSAGPSAAADVLCGLEEFTGVWALDGTTFQASDTEENRAEWPYAAGPKPGCGFPVVGALVAHSLVGKGSSVLVTAPWSAHDFRLFVEASPRFKDLELHVGDRAFCSFTAFAILSETGSDGIFRGKDWCRKRRADDVRVGDGDRITRWAKRRSKQSTTVSRERRDGLPDEIAVRVMTAKIRVRGFRDEEIVLVTSFLDGKKYPKKRILELYPMGDRGVLPRHEDDAALRVHQGADAAHREARARSSRPRVQPDALCHGARTRAGAAMRNRQHRGCDNGVRRDHADPPLCGRFALGSVLKARRRCRGRRPEETKAEELCQGGQATSKTISFAEKTAF